MAKTTATHQANMTAGRRFLSDRLDWNLLRTYLVIAQESSISRAAARLHVTQSAVSQALKRLEDPLQCTLILRQGTRFALTATGRVCLEGGAALLARGGSKGWQLNRYQAAAGGKDCLPPARLASRDVKQ